MAGSRHSSRQAHVTRTLPRLSLVCSVLLLAGWPPRHPPYQPQPVGAETLNGGKNVIALRP